MIKYRLRCVRGHEFETWFANGEAFEKLAKRHQLTCATCGSDKVEKAIMSPRVAKSRGGRNAPSVEPQVPVRMERDDDGAERQAMRAALTELRQKVIENADYVGPRFAEEARRIHEEDAPARGIYGEASIKEARELIEDGISIMPLPPAPDKQN